MNVSTLAVSVAIRSSVGVDDGGSKERRVECVETDSECRSPYRASRARRSISWSTEVGGGESLGDGLRTEKAGTGAGVLFKEGGSLDWNDNRKEECWLWSRSCVEVPSRDELVGVDGDGDS